MSPRIRSQSTLTVGPASQTLCLPTTIPRPLQVTPIQTGLWASFWQLLSQSPDRVHLTHPLDSAPIPFTKWVMTRAAIPPPRSRTGRTLSDPVSRVSDHGRWRTDPDRSILISWPSCPPGSGTRKEPATIPRARAKSLGQYISEVATSGTRLRPGLGTCRALHGDSPQLTMRPS